MTSWDILVVACIASIGIYLLIANQGSAGWVRMVQVSSSLGFEKIYKLEDHTTIEVEGRLGKSVIEISRKGARFIDSSCPNHLCVRRGWVSKSGDMVACVPNGVVVRIVGKREYDAITP